MARSLVFYGLNVVRLLSIIALLLVFSSSILVMVTNIKAVNAFQNAKIHGTSASGNDTDANIDELMLDCDYIMGSTVPNQPAGVFWSVVATLLIIFQVIVLLLSELGWPMKFFDRYFPVLGSAFGVGALGIFQCLIGAQILSHHVDEFTLVAAFFLFSIGCLNMLLGLIFREGAKQKRGFSSSGNNDDKSFLPTFKPNQPIFVSVNPPATVNGQPISTPQEFQSWRSGATVVSPDNFMEEKANFGFGRQAEKNAALKGFILQAPQAPEEALPRYASPSPQPSRVPSPAPSAPVSVAPSSPEAPSPAPTNPFLTEESTPPLRLKLQQNIQRMKSTRSDTSSFVSPSARRQERAAHLAPPVPHYHHREDDAVSASHYEEEEEDEESMYAATPTSHHSHAMEFPIPTYMASTNRF